MSEQTTMLMLPTKWDVTKEEDRKQAELLGKDPETTMVTEDGFIYVNLHRIDGINRSTMKGTCVLRFDGDIFNIDMPLESLIRLLKSNGVTFKTINNEVL